MGGTAKGHLNHCPGGGQDGWRRCHVGAPHLCGKRADQSAIAFVAGSSCPTRRGPVNCCNAISRVQHRICAGAATRAQIFSAAETTGQRSRHRKRHRGPESSGLSARRPRSRGPSPPRPGPRRRAGRRSRCAGDGGTQIGAETRACGRHSDWHVQPVRCRDAPRQQGCKAAPGKTRRAFVKPDEPGKLPHLAAGADMRAAQQPALRKFGRQVQIVRPRQDFRCRAAIVGPVQPSAGAPDRAHSPPGQQQRPHPGFHRV